MCSLQIPILLLPYILYNNSDVTPGWVTGICRQIRFSFQEVTEWGKGNWMNVLQNVQNPSYKINKYKEYNVQHNKYN